MVVAGFKLVGIAQKTYTFIELLKKISTRLLMIAHCCGWRAFKFDEVLKVLQKQTQNFSLEKEKNIFPYLLRNGKTNLQ